MIRYSLITALALVATPVFAQPNPPRDGRGRAEEGAAPGVDALIERLLTFDANKDGALAKSELTDERLHSLFDRADANKDGTATKAELKELLTKESAALAQSGRRGGPMGGGPEGGPQGPGGAPPRDGDGPPRDGDRGRGPQGDRPDGGQPRDGFRGQPGGRGPMGEGAGGDRRGFGGGFGGGGFGGGGFGGQRPRPGQVLPPGVQERLGLSDEQRRKVEALQEIVDTQLEKILTPEQKKMMSDFGPPQGGPGGFDRGPGADGGPPRGEGGAQRGPGGPGGPGRDRQRPNSADRPVRPAVEP